MAVRTQPRLKRVSLREDVVRSGKVCKVDREAGIIYGVKLSGLESLNNRRYTLECLKRAVPMYEGAACNINHPERSPTQSRSAYDRFGRFVNVRSTDDGLYADLHYLKSHPMAATICEAAERMPDAFGFSHNAKGDYRLADGVEVVEAIVEVRSVDLVADPATTKSLCESEEITVKTKLRDMVEAKTKFGKLLKPLVEEDGMGDVEMTATDGDWKADILAAVKKLLDSDDADDHAAVDALMKIVKPKAAPVPEEEGSDEGSADDKDKKKDSDKVESLQRRLAAFERKDKVRDLCEAAGVTPDKALLEALNAITDEALVKKLIDREKGKGKPQKPGVRSGNYFTESRNDTNGEKVPTTAKEFVAAITCN